jgi:hypothetical protein
MHAWTYFIHLDKIGFEFTTLEVAAPYQSLIFCYLAKRPVLNLKDKPRRVLSPLQFEIPRPPVGRYFKKETFCLKSLHFTFEQDEWETSSHNQIKLFFFFIADVPDK